MFDFKWFEPIHVYTLYIYSTIILLFFWLVFPLPYLRLQTYTFPLFHTSNQFTPPTGIDYEAIRAQHPTETFTKVFTFNSARKSMSTVIPLEGGGYRLLTKGASEIVLYKCTQIMGNEGEVKIFFFLKIKLHVCVQGVMCACFGMLHIIICTVVSVLGPVGTQCTCAAELKSIE